MQELIEVVPEGQYAYAHKIDNVLFSHGGLKSSFVKFHVPSKYYNNIDFCINRINHLTEYDVWQDYSPIWFRPQNLSKSAGYIYYSKKLLQVVGHTPVRKAYKRYGVLSCDTFSTYPDGSKFGSETFVIVNTLTKNWFETA